MKIVHVVFRSNISVGGFQHVHVEAGAEVGDNENPSQVLDELKLFVATELKKAKEGSKPVKIPISSRPFSDIVKDILKDSEEEE